MEKNELQGSTAEQNQVTHRSEFTAHRILQETTQIYRNNVVDLMDLTTGLNDAINHLEELLDKISNDKKPLPNYVTVGIASTKSLLVSHERGLSAMQSKSRGKLNGEHERDIRRAVLSGNTVSPV